MISNQLTHFLELDENNIRVQREGGGTQWTVFIVLHTQCVKHAYSDYGHSHRLEFLGFSNFLYANEQICIF